MEAIKPRQIINYDAEYLVIDLHQLNVKTTSDNTNQRHWIRGNLMSTKNRTRRTTTHSIRFPNQMIEQINALEQKRSGISQPGSLKPAVGDNNVRKREHIHQLKVMKNEHPAFFPLEQDDIVNSLNYRGHCSNWVAVLPLSWQWQTACWLCHRLNSFEWLAWLVISLLLKNNPSYYYRASPTLPQFALDGRDTLCSIHAITTSG